MCLMPSMPSAPAPPAPAAPAPTKTDEDVNKRAEEARRAMDLARKGFQADYGRRGWNSNIQQPDPSQLQSVTLGS